MNAFADDAIRMNAHSIFGNITNRQLPLCAFEVHNISNEIQRLAHKIQFYHRWNTAQKGIRDRSDAIELYKQILDALTSKGFYDEKSQREVLQNTKVFTTFLYDLFASYIYV